ncbi:ATP-binding protein [Lignipirellula cremea]|uniref:AAA-like domain protein n=1 Tax=Lignipirellula cremea TaxID=2528010 RepID=A0A518DV25_9BACT|nr:ATP-binding protein [Lignipirellula cremea]QDU95674.1 AAA-like domain protein [Lignipirellula cremea]
MQDFEKLGAFYLGKQYDMGEKKRLDDLLLYDAKDLTTHGMCVGMTGSGKTGLCLSLLEEAAIDGIPAIAIDPKGDLGNLMLTFPGLTAEEFRPWIDEGEALRQGLSADEYAAHTAAQWKEGLAEWGQDGARIERLKQAADVAIYTPGGGAGLQLTVLRSFSAPGPAVVADGEAFRDLISGAVSGLLALLKIDADPIRSREFILLSNILDAAWKTGRNLTLPQLIHSIQSPPFEKVGFIDLESFYPQKDRFELAMALNNLLASPAFASWMEGEPLDIQKLLYTPEGRPRLAILSIAHLTDAERMFFVTILLNELVAWMRNQPGSNSLRALLYMDEVFSYFPPTANPPSKKPMLTLLKQARAYGLGVMLATQNPVDLDYKGLSNMGTWFLGRLQTERDKMRVLEGLEGAAADSGVRFDRSAMEATLAGLGNRVFLMHNVHEDGPVVFQTRWALSYLRGPLSKPQIEKLMAPRKAGASAAPPGARSASAAAASTAAASGGDSFLDSLVPVRAPAPTSRASGPAVEVPPPATKPVLPPEVEQAYLPVRERVAPGEQLVYVGAILGEAKVHFVKSTYKVDDWVEFKKLKTLDVDSDSVDWSDAEPMEEGFELETKGDLDGSYQDLPKTVSSRGMKKWESELKSALYRDETLSVWKCTALKEYSELAECEGDFRIRLSQAAREYRDLQIEKLRSKYASKLDTLQERIRKAEQAVDRERGQYRSSQVSTAVSFGTSILGALFGRKLTSVTNVTRAGSSMRAAGRTAQQYSDISRAQEDVEKLKREYQELEDEARKETDAIQESFNPQEMELEELEVTPRKSDITIERILLLWTPWIRQSDGHLHKAH